MLKEGDKAPDFSSKDQNGNPVELSDFKGQKVVLYFYPKDDTPGCTKEACSFRDADHVYRDKGIKVLGVSTDDEKSHQKFISKFQLPFDLLADTDKDIVEKVHGNEPENFPDRRGWQDRQNFRQSKRCRTRRRGPFGVRRKVRSNAGVRLEVICEI